APFRGRTGAAHADTRSSPCTNALAPGLTHPPALAGRHCSFVDEFLQSRVGYIPALYFTGILQPCELLADGVALIPRWQSRWYLRRVRACESVRKLPCRILGDVLAGVFVVVGEVWP